ncbi:uncharacterized protein zgc:174935 [Engraulis encrasicolus]|uniref:uncharacterized protein zgc:174935 n=1 Tax=Engraulis encrasicolus TaxID=184585 RepID=UPI002FCFE1D6
MRCGIFFIVVMLAGTVSLTILIHKKKIQEVSLAKEANFEEIKNKVTKDVLTEVVDNLSKDKSNLESKKKMIEEVKTAIQNKQNQAAAARHDAEECQGETKRTADELANLEADQNTLNNEKEAWTREIESLQKDLAQKSKVCDYILKDSEEAKKLCGEAAEPKKEEPKKEEEKKVEEKKEEPKKEEGQAEEPPKLPEEPPKPPAEPAKAR